MEHLVTKPVTPEKRKSEHLNKFDNFERRLLDIVASSLGLIFLSPVFLIISILIKYKSPGPVYFKGKRMGRYGKPFNIIKFRTMHENPDSYQGAKITAQDDPRITPVGKWLRTTKLNELPQLGNILRGEMSLVGPRPEDVEIANTWTDKQKEVLLSVRPGMTSPASVVYSNEEELLSHADGLDRYFKEIMPDKMRLDMLYILQRNFLSDIDVIFCTLIALLPGWRKIRVKNWELYYGPLTRFLNRFAFWFIIDILLTFFSFAATAVIYRLNTPLDVGWGASLVIVGSFSLFFSLSNAALHLYNVEWSRAPSGYAVQLLFSAGIAMLGVNLVLFIFPNLFRELPFILTVVAIALTVILAIAIRYRERLITTIASRWLKLRGGVRDIGENVLIIGAGKNASAVEWLLNQSSSNQWFHIVGMIDDQPTIQQMAIGYARVLGTTEQIQEIVEENNIGLICFTIHNISESDKERILNQCKNTGIRTIEMPDFFGILGKAFQQNEKEPVSS